MPKKTKRKNEEMELIIFLHRDGIINEKEE